MEYSMEELIPIVAMLADKYTAKESTSISERTAEQLMGAVLYCIRECETTSYGDILWSDEKCGMSGVTGNIVSGKHLKPLEAYRIGMQLVTAKFEETQCLYHELMQHFRDYGNRAYRDTVAVGMPQFFTAYDFNFCPQEHLLTLDYPVLYRFPAECCGIDRICGYLKALVLEQEFLYRIPDTYVFHVLNAYGNYEEFFLNLPTVVLKNLLAAALVGRKPSVLSYTLAEQQMLKQRILSLDAAEQLQHEIMAKLEQMIEQGYSGNTLLTAYLRLSVQDICTELRNAAQNDCISSVIAV